MNANRRNALVAVTLLALVRPAHADVIVDWNQWAIDFIVSHKMPPPPAERISFNVYVDTTLLSQLGTSTALTSAAQTA